MIFRMLGAVLFFATAQQAWGTAPPWYNKNRVEIIDQERRASLGGSLILTSNETLVDNIIMEMKQKIFDQARVNGTIFPPAESFFLSKSSIDQSDLFHIIQKMPKGCALHIHDSSLVSLRWVVANITYRPNCYMCFEKDGSLRFHFYQTPPVNTSDCAWKLVQSYRNASGDPEKFDKMLIQNMSIIVDNPSVAYPTIDQVWMKFKKYFQAINGLFLYAPVFRDYFYRALEEFYDDNVTCLEVRALLLPTYELDGSTHNSSWALKVYYDTVQEFTQTHPDFSGAKIIVSSSRSQNVPDILQAVKQTIAFRQQYSDFVAGYDLVGQEDIGNSLLYYIDDLLYPTEQKPPVLLPYFFHAGESDWLDSFPDENLIDAILLNATRIGHGYAAIKHPMVLKTIKDYNIPIEVNPISNQVLGLVADLRNHPATFLIANNFPVVISSDDPAVWEAAPLSHDVYMALMALSGERSGVGLLKQLATSSIVYSSMNTQEAIAALKVWNTQWDHFIDSMLYSKMSS